MKRISFHALPLRIKAAIKTYRDYKYRECQGYPRCNGIPEWRVTMFNNGSKVCCRKCMTDLFYLEHGIDIIKRIDRI